MSSGRPLTDKPFSELSSVLFDHRGASIVGHILLDTLEEAGYSVDDFDAVAFMLIRLGEIRSELKNIFVINYKRTW